MKDKFDMTIFYFLGCVIISSAIVIFFSRKASLYSYGTMSFTLFSLFFLVYSFIRNKPIPKVNFREILGIMEHGFPIFLLFLITSWLFFINIKFYDRIQSGNLSPDYAKYEYFSLGFLITEIIILLQLIKYMATIASKELVKDPSVTEDKVGATKMRAGLYVLTLFNGIFVGILHTIIAYFTTDG
jgi:hypothetical protein